MEINMSLSPISASRAKARILRYADNLERKVNELCRRLAEYGLTEAKVGFETAPYDGEREVKVIMKPYNSAKDHSTGYYIIADGKTVAFLEFGAGVHYPDSHPLAGKYKALHGTYGKGHGKQDYWFFTGQPGENNAGGELAHGHRNTTITHGNPASMTMYNTAQDLHRIVERVAREVFASD